MFCSKCGTQSIEGSAFCQKCGAKFINGEQAASPIASSEPRITEPIQSQTANSSSTKPKKKKRLPIIIAGVVGLFSLIGIIGSPTEDDTPRARPSAGVSISSPQPSPQAHQSPQSNSQAETTSASAGVATYSIPNYDFASSVPDFLAFTTNGAELTNDSNTEISHGSVATVDMRYTYEWSEGERNNYHDLLRDAGFSAHYSRDGRYEWTSDDVNLITMFETLGVVSICIINNLHNDGPGDDYYDESDSVSTRPIDLELTNGRWVSEDGKRLELFADGTGTTNLGADGGMWSTIRYNVSRDGVLWQAQNGRLALAAQVVYEDAYEITSSDGVDQIRLPSSYGTTTFNRREGDSGVVGVWMPRADGGFQINADGTGRSHFFNAWEGEEFTWYENNGVLTRTFTSAYEWDYTVSGNTLTLFGRSGSIQFSRVGGN